MSVPSKDASPRARCSMLRGAAALALAAIALPALAQQAWPAKPVRIVVGVPPGGFTDSVARLVAPKLTEALGQQFNVENRTGASGIIAIETALKAPADGYTLLVATNAEMAVNPHVLAKIPYDPFRDFVPIAPVAVGTLVVATGGGAPFGTLQDLVTAVRAKPGAYSWASAGNATVNHLAGAWLANVARLDMVHVPYKGGGPAAADVVGGQIPIGVLAAAAALPHVKTGRVRVLAITSAKRLSFAPEIPTVAESGYPGFDVALWAAFFGQPGFPKEVVARLNTELNRAIRLPDVGERMNAIAADVLGGTPDDLVAMVRADHERYGKVARDNNIRAE